MAVRLGKTLLFGSGALVGGGVGYSIYQAEGDVSNIGAIRLVKMLLWEGKISIFYILL